jgi:Na+(H+)/acetate symporter ActP
MTSESRIPHVITWVPVWMIPNKGIRHIITQVHTVVSMKTAFWDEGNMHL